MNRTHRFAALFALVTCAAACSQSAATEAAPSAAAATPATAPEGVWRGHGVVVGGDGQELSAFDVEVAEHRIDAQTLDLDGEVRLADGRKITFRQRRIGSADRFRLETERGSGGGMCFGEGLCQTYEDAGEGRAFASTLVHDEGGRLRVLTTELERGRAVRFTRQSLVKSE